VAGERAMMPWFVTDGELRWLLALDQYRQIQ
jgi:hypothetical protein